MNEMEQLTTETTNKVPPEPEAPDDGNLSLRVATLHEKLKQTQLLLLQEKRSMLETLQYQLTLAKSQIMNRTKQMIRELWEIYPINEFPDGKGYSICDIHLPNADNLEGHDEMMVSSAIGYVGHLLLILSNILDVALRFPLRYQGSRLHIDCSRKNQSFPLYMESFKRKDWMNFLYGIDLLNLDIKQIRTLYGLQTLEPKDTLANLHGLKVLLATSDD